MTTYGGTYTSLDPTSYVPRTTPSKRANPRRSPVVYISGQPRDRAFTNVATREPVRKRKAYAGSNFGKRPTTEWTGLTDHSLIPATNTQRKQFDAQRKAKKAAK